MLAHTTAAGAGLQTSRAADDPRHRRTFQLLPSVLRAIEAAQIDRIRDRFFRLRGAASAVQSECLFVSRGKSTVIGRRLVARPGSGLAEEPVAGV